jgi:Flp pilus assembly protein TadG
LEGTAARGRWGSERERGQALVEFVVILPVFLLIVFAVFEFGRAFNYWIDATHLANEGARYAAVRRCDDADAGPPGCTPLSLETFLRDQANTGEFAANMDVTYCWDGDLPGGDQGSAIRVTVTGKYAPLESFLSIFGVDTEIDLEGSSTMRMESDASDLWRPPAVVIRDCAA